MLSECLIPNIRRLLLSYSSKIDYHFTEIGGPFCQIKPFGIRIWDLICHWVLTFDVTEQYCAENRDYETLTTFYQECNQKNKQELWHKKMS